MKKWILLSVGVCMAALVIAQQKNAAIIPAAERISEYYSLLKGKKVAIFANPTSIVGQTHLVDTLQKLQVNIVKIFAPEHGFRGDADAGESVATYTDKKTGIQVVSLYGKKVKPSADDLRDIDVVVFDIQDVGVRFYTYISSLEELMNGVFENGKKLIILDRPNPNGGYVDGPVLDMAYKSFIGMKPVPVVYGMTIGEYASMLVGERWLNKLANSMYTNKAGKNTGAPAIKIVLCANYTHASSYELPVKPSPNLSTNEAILVYPSTCFFEGTVLSEGRGTEHPFQIFGHPSLPKSLYSFTPRSTEGAKNPKLKDQVCYGWNISGQRVSRKQIELKWLLQAYELFPAKDSFFILPKSKIDKEVFFNKLAGNNLLIQQIKNGTSEADIRKSWQPGIDKFMTIRAKYLLYK